MWKRKGFKAFSLTEVLIAMVLGTLVMGTAIAGYLFFQKQYFTFQKSEEKILVLAQLNDCLHRDFAHAKSVKANGNDLTFQFVDDTWVKYQINSDNITRELESVSETFDAEIITYQVFYDNASTNTQWPILDELVIELEQSKLHYFKTYGADFKLTYEKLLNQ